MLDKIRHVMKNFFAKLLFLIVAISFISSLFDTDKTKSYIVATVGKEIFSLDDFLKVKQEETSLLKQNSDLSPEQMQAALSGINNRSITKIITKSLISQEIKNLGIQVSPEVVADYIHHDSYFQKNGKFDLETYKKIIEHNNLNEDMFLEQVANEVASKFLLNSLTVNLPLKKNLTDYLYSYLSEKLAISIIKTNLEKQNFTNINDQALQDFHKQNSQYFQSPEYRSFEYLLFSAKNLQQDIKISSEELQKEYDENKEEFALPETRDFHHFLIPDQQTAQQVLEALKQNPEASKVAKSFIDKKVISEIFTNQSSHSFLSSLDPSLFKLKENEISGIINSDLGIHIFKIIKIHPKQYQDFAKIKDQVMDKALAKKSELQLYEFSKTIEDDIASGASLNDISTRNNIPLIQANKVSLIDGNSNIPQEIINLAFSTAINEESPITNIHNNQDFVIVKTKEIESPKLQDFSLVKSKILELYSTKLKGDVALEMTKALQAAHEQLIFPESSKLNNKLVQETLKPIFDKYNLPMKQINSIVTLENIEVTRSGSINNANLPPLFLSELFNLKLKQASIPEKFSANSYAFAIVQEILPNAEKDPKLYKQVEEVSENNFKNEMMDQYLEYLRNKYPTTINMELLNNKSDE